MIGGYGLGSFDSGQGQMVGFCERGNEPFGSINTWDFVSPCATISF